MGMGVRDRYLVGKVAPKGEADIENIEGLQGLTAPKETGAQRMRSAQVRRGAIRRRRMRQTPRLGWRVKSPCRARESVLYQGKMNLMRA